MLNLSVQALGDRSRRGKPSSRPIEANVVTFSSRGALGVTAPANTGNTFYTLNETGSPFDGSQDGAYRQIVNVLDMSNYASANLFGAYDYYKVESCETTFYVKEFPTSGQPVFYEIFYVLDKDSREAAASNPLSEVCNRSALASRSLYNSALRQTVEWKPYLIEDSNTFDVSGRQVDYVQPRERWLNTANYESHRFGNLKSVLTVPNRTIYNDETPVIGVRHRIVLKFKGQKSVQ